jgi:4-amino-4-deoxy-L-arabinose transferase-like glycosyltransferase
VTKIATFRALPTGKCSPLAVFLVLLSALTVARVVWLWLSPLPLYGDEAQYWTWAQHLDWGYYSKPPLLAWMIALMTAVGGNAEFWVRVASPLAHAGTALAVYLLAARAFDARAALWSGIAYATLPAVFLSSTLMSTDVFLLLFWAWGLYFLWRGLIDGHGRWWVLCGASVGLALLAKYAAIAFWVSAALVLVCVPGFRPWLRRWPPYAALGISLAVLAPNLWWNVQHGFVTFRHTRDNANLSGGGRFEPGELGEFLSAQFGVMGPVLFAVLLGLLLRRPWRRSAGDSDTAPADALLFHFTWPLLAFMTVQALLSRANANWAAAAYVAGTVLVAAFLVRQGRAGWLRFSTGLHVLVAVLAFSLPLLPFNLPGKYDPFRRIKGYDRLVADVVQLEQTRFPGTAILADDRMLTALLMYYGRDGRLPAVVKWNGDPAANDYYEMTTSIRQFDCYLLVTRDPPVGIAPRFRRAEQVATLDVPTHSDRGLKYFVWVLEGLKADGE